MELMEPKQSKSSQFVERWSKAEQRNSNLAFALLSVIGVCIILASAMAYMTTRPRPIYFIPGATEAGMALPLSSSQAMVSTFVSSWILNWNNFTPVTAQEVYARAQKFMSPRLLAQTRSRLSKDIDEIKRNSISSLFSITQDPSIMTEKIGFRVSVQGDKGVYMGKDEIKLQHITFLIRVRRVDPTENNPYGLLIEDIDQETAT